MAGYAFFGVYTFERAHLALAELKPETGSEYQIIAAVSEEYPYLQVGSALPSGGQPHVILRSLQKLHGVIVFFRSVGGHRDGAFNGFIEDIADTCGGFKVG